MQVNYYTLMKLYLIGNIEEGKYDMQVNYYTLMKLYLIGNI